MPVSLAQSVSDLSPLSEDIELPEACTKGLESYQIRDMQECVLNIREGTGIYLAACANNLYELRNSLKGNKKGNPRQWTQFKKSELVPFKPREITDLVTAWEGWFSTTQLSPDTFNLVGIRTAAKIAGATDRIKAVIEADLERGTRVTEKMVDELIAPASKVGKIQNPSWLEIKKGYEAKLKKMDTKKLLAEALAQREMVFKLSEELKTKSSFKSEVVVKKKSKV